MSGHVFCWCNDPGILDGVPSPMCGGKCIGCGETEETAEQICPACQCGLGPFCPNHESAHEVKLR